jgi:hypothetical protein
MSEILVTAAMNQEDGILVVTLSPGMRGLITDVKAIEATIDRIAQEAHNELLSSAPNVKLASATLILISEIKVAIQHLLTVVSNGSVRTVKTSKVDINENENDR